MKVAENKKKHNTISTEPIFNDEDEPYLLKIDWDWIPPKEYIDYWRDNIVPDIIYEYFKLFPEKFAIIILHIKKFRSRSKHGLHWYITLNQIIDDDKKCMLQFMLGDDKKRCKLNWQSIQIGLSDWNKFYEDYYYKKVE